MNDLRIDTHHHFYPPAYARAKIERISFGKPYPREMYLNWTPKLAMDVMESAGIDAAVLSLSNPSVWFGNADEGRALARESNEFAAQVVRDYPYRFGAFAAIPLPDIAGSLREIEHVIDVLKLDGITVLSSYDGKYLGHSDFKEVLAELNRREAVVFVHPTAPPSCASLDPVIPNGIIELPYDSLRTITNLVFSGSAVSFPKIRWVFSHCGGTLVSLAGRLAEYADTKTPEQRQSQCPRGFLHEIGRFFYDVASVADEPVVHGMLKIVPQSQLLFGTDYPFVPTTSAADGIERVPLTPEVRSMIKGYNAKLLLPSFARRLEHHA